MELWVLLCFIGKFLLKRVDLAIIFFALLHIWDFIKKTCYLILEGRVFVQKVLSTILLRGRLTVQFLGELTDLIFQVVDLWVKLTILCLKEFEVFLFDYGILL